MLHGKQFCCARNAHDMCVAVLLSDVGSNAAGKLDIVQKPLILEARAQRGKTRAVEIAF